jgi:hypothetical protein
MTRKSLGLKGDETVSIHGLEGVKPLQVVPCTITYGDGTSKTIDLKCRIDTAVEIDYIENGGVLHYVLRSLAACLTEPSTPRPLRPGLLLCTPCPFVTQAAPIPRALPDWTPDPAQSPPLANP